MGTSCSCSKLLAQRPIMKPKRLKVSAVSTRKAIIHSGCRI